MNRSASILFEDNHVLVVNKPVNIPVQEDSSGDADLLRVLKEYIKTKYRKPGNVFLGLVHRLDRPVGGVMVFARTSKAASRLSEQIRNRSMGKIYLAVIEGTAEPSDRLRHWIQKHAAQNKVTVTDTPTGHAQEAILQYTTVQAGASLSLVRVVLETGRPHQIRAQFSAIGHPLWGDQKYGNGIKGQFPALHASELRFEHPVTRESLHFIAPAPAGEPWDRFTK